MFLLIYIITKDHFKNQFVFETFFIENYVDHQSSDKYTSIIKIK